MRSGPNIADGKAQQFSVSKIDGAFDFYKPMPPLSRFVDLLWLSDSRTTGLKPERILPTGTFELAINLRHDRLVFYDPERPDEHSQFSGAVVSGAHGRGFAPGDTEDVFIIGVHFKPGGAFPFLGVPAGDLADIHVDLETLWGSSAVRLREWLGEARDSAERFRLLERALLSRLSDRVEQHYAVAAGLETLGKYRVGQTVREAAKYLGLSQRRFIQVFKAEVGITPKLFSRIRRFQQTRSVIHQSPSPDWAAIAADLGYFDQSHFIREFTEFSGLTPTEYINRQRNSI